LDKLKRKAFEIMEYKIREVPTFSTGEEHTEAIQQAIKQRVQYILQHLITLPQLSYKIQNALGQVLTS
jgi:hypothetical protein